MHDPVLLDETLRPSPPLPPAALRFVLVAVFVINLVFATAFALRGAWLVTPFMGLDVLLLAWALRASVRAARQHERVRLTPTRLVVERHPASGTPTEIAFNPYWVRVDMAEPSDHWSQLTLHSHGRGIRVGSFLPPRERAFFARTLKAALKRARETSSV